MNETFVKRYREYLKANINSYDNNPMQQRLFTAYTIAVKTHYMGIEDWRDFLIHCYYNPGAELEILLNGCKDQIEKDLEAIPEEVIEIIEPKEIPEIASKTKKQLYRQEYYQKNKEEMLKYQKEYYQKNKEERKEYQRDYYKRCKEEETN